MAGKIKNIAGMRFGRLIAVLGWSVEHALSIKKRINKEEALRLEGLK